MKTHQKAALLVLVALLFSTTSASAFKLQGGLGLGLSDAGGSNAGSVESTLGVDLGAAVLFQITDTLSLGPYVGYQFSKHGFEFVGRTTLKFANGAFGAMLRGEFGQFAAEGQLGFAVGTATFERGLEIDDGYSGAQIGGGAYFMIPVNPSITLDLGPYLLMDFLETNDGNDDFSLIHFGLGIKVSFTSGK